MPLSEPGSDYFQEAGNDALFSYVAVFRATITSPDQLPQMLETAVRHALGRKGVAVLTVPGDLGERELTADRPARFSLNAPVSQPEESTARRTSSTGPSASPCSSAREPGLRGRTFSPLPTGRPRPWCSP